MRLKNVFFGIFTLLTFIPIYSMEILPIPLPQIPSDLPINPDFALELIQSNLELVQLTFDNPQNSFGVITDPQQRLSFLQGISSSLVDISTSLSIILPQIGINIDSSIITTINDEILIINNLISERVSNYLLPLNTSQIQIDTNFIIYRLNQSIPNIITFSPTIQIELPIIYQTLNHSLYDLSLQIRDGINTFPSDKIVASIDTLLIKLSDIQANIPPLDKLQTQVIFEINKEVCPSTLENCNLLCGIWDSVINDWKTYPSEFINLNQITCKVDLVERSNNKINSQLMKQGIPQFLTVSTLIDSSLPSKDNSLSAGDIAGIVTGGFLIVSLALGYCYYRYRKKGINSDDTQRLPNYHSIEV